ncbi:MAG: amidase, partial [Bacteroidetes bacterium]
MSQVNFPLLFNLCTSLALLFATACQPTATPPPLVAATSGSIDLEETDITQIQKDYAAGTYTSVELVQAYLDRIATIDDSGPMLNAIIQVNPEALQIAAALDQERAAGNVRGPLHGIPVVLKDNIETHDQMATTAGSRALLNSHPLQDSYLAEKLRAAGAIILGKAN